MEAKKLAHKDANEAGLLVLAENIVKPDDREMLHFVDTDSANNMIDVFVPAPDVSESECPECSAVGDWEIVDHDWEGDKKFVRLTCQRQYADRYGVHKCCGEKIVWIKE